MCRAMKTTIPALLAAGCLLGAAAWFVSRNKENVTPADDTQQTTPAAPAEVTEMYRDHLFKGVDYLVRQQCDDGHWEADDGACPVAMTGLAGLAILLARDRPFHTVGDEMMYDTAKSALSVRKAADWLMAHAHADRGGLLFSNHPSELSRYMQGHGLATIFLAGVCARERDEARKKKLTDVVGQAVTYIAHAQSSQGGWHDTSREEGHDFATTPATVIQMQALQAAENASVPVRPEALADGYAYLGSLPEKEVSPADQAAVLACLGKPRRPRVRPVMPESWIAACRSREHEVRFGLDERVHYYWAQVGQNLGGDAWKRYRSALVERLKSAQNKDGSWPAGDGWGTGRTYATAIWCTILQLHDHNHPSSQPDLDMLRL
jgi:Prenyltransferase and squalene oxidase repeat